MKQAILNLHHRLWACRGVLVHSSARALTEVAEHTTLIIHPIIYAEVSIGYTTVEALDEVLPASLYRRATLPWEAGFLAGKSFLQYRKRGGSRILAPTKHKT